MPPATRSSPAGHSQYSRLYTEALCVPVKPRRFAREIALSTLYQLDVTGETRERALKSSLAMLVDLKREAERESGGRAPSRKRERAVRDQVAEAAEFAEQLTRTALDSVGELDEIITEFAEGWSVDRMPGIDRNILRLALAEILHFDDIPVSVSIDEAVELAKAYSTEESGSFVNGILGAFVRSRGLAAVDG